MKAYLINLGDAYRFGRWSLMFAIDTIFKTFGQREHCKNSYLHDVAKAGALVDEHVRRLTRE